MSVSEFRALFLKLFVIVVAVTTIPFFARQPTAKVSADAAAAATAAAETTTDNAGADNIFQHQRKEEYGDEVEVSGALREDVAAVGAAVEYSLSESTADVNDDEETTTSSLKTATSNFNYRPHILMVVMDDMGSNDLGLHGTGISTPVTDELAKTGLFMNNYYVLPKCTPTRISIMSGRYPYAMGWYRAMSSRDTQGMPLDEETLPEVLSRAGYKTHGTGKWHLGHAKEKYLPTFRGFQSWFGYHAVGGGDHFKHNGKGAYDMWHDKREFCGRGCSRISDERGNYSSHVFAREAIHMIQNHGTDEPEPLFLYLAFYAVHKPIQVPKKYIAEYQNKNWSNEKKKYAGMLSAADESLGHVISALKKSGLWDDTLVIFTSDNGGTPSGSNKPHRGYKSEVWEGGVVSDGIISGPARSKLGIRGGQFEHLFHSVDWLPTLAEIVRTRPDGKQLHGVSQLGSLRENKASRTELFLGHDVLEWNGQRGKNRKLPPITAVRSGNWKLITDARSGNKKLFNLRKDPGERRNLAKKYPKICKSLKSKMNQYLYRVSKAVIQANRPCGKEMINYATPWGEKAPNPWCS